ncbi:WD40-repeat-containing domain protein [Mycotypha africana]|uniref:WD40-repeat-containing domain protein n=1 Tax=Mycotypha africana TaxID=64632 RepID=UPI002300F5E1|nr:WD40-repeat-containing domain protein [Mycotypha africana]KAI8967521.1 WD40-repeat-containing domain protein [Mycotypha africana]
MTYSLSFIFSTSLLSAKKEEKPSIHIPLYITIYPRKDGKTAKTKCLNPQYNTSKITPLKRKLKASSSNLSSRLLPKFSSRRSSFQSRRPSSLYSFHSSNSGLEIVSSSDNLATSTLVNMPTEIISKVLYFLDCTSIHKLSRTCTKMYSICNDDDLWRKLLYADFQFIVPPSPQTTDVTVTQTLKKDDSTFDVEGALVLATRNTHTQMSKLIPLQQYNTRFQEQQQQQQLLKKQKQQQWKFLIQPSVNRQLYKNHCLLGRRWVRGQVNATRYLSGHADNIYCLAWLSKNIVISGGRGRTLKIWNVKTNQFIRSIETDSPTIETNRENEDANEELSRSFLCMRVNKDRSVLATGTKDATCILWSLPSLTVKCILRGHGHSILSVCFVQTEIDQEGQQCEYVITGSKDHTARVWDKNTGREVRQLIGHHGPVNSVEYAGDNRVVTASSDATLKIWNVLTGECIKTIETRQRCGVSCIQNIGPHLYTGSVEGKIKIWDIETGECIKTMIGHIGIVRSIDYSNGKIVTGGYDRTLKVWDPKSGACILSFQSGHSGLIFSVLVSGTQIVSSGEDGRIMVIDFGSDLNPL